MDQKKLDRINELARKKRTDSLSEEEIQEQAALRAEYIAEYRASVRNILDNTYIQRPGGAKEKLKKKPLS